MGIDKKTLGIISTKVRINRRLISRANAMGLRYWLIVSNPPGRGKPPGRGRIYHKFYMRARDVQRLRRRSQ
ncbi:MAG: hypothetical protein M3077_05750 [Candidatus Dormibacteraeota bacterium]|nr:hypothetical protein [Candidatus Dormibacteraeota bacterium]